VASQNRKVAIIATLIIMSVMVVVALVSKTFEKPLLISRTDPPKIKVAEKEHAFGSVEEGTEVPHVFKIQNIGGKPLQVSAETSCGCTQLDLSTQKVLPGESAELKVTMDTSLKKGFVSKIINVHSNDPQTPILPLTISANVLPRNKSNTLPMTMTNPDTPSVILDPNQAGTNPDMADPHASLMLKPGQPVKLFTGKCASCHVQQGLGKKGSDLYMADCAMCHGLDAKGKVGPSLVGPNYDDKATVDKITHIIKFGSPTHPSMPGFSKAAGGPLTDDEIQSLVDYLGSTAKAQKNTPAATAN
jgi:mono/diheme cytochrome c family protein